MKFTIIQMTNVSKGIQEDYVNHVICIISEIMDLIPHPKGLNVLNVKGILFII
jgi:hypothetical protein